MPVTVDIRCADCSRLLGFEIRFYEKKEYGLTIYRTEGCGCLRERARKIRQIEDRLARVSKGFEITKCSKGERKHERQTV